MVAERLSISENPFLGPQWEPLAEALAGVLHRAITKGRPFSMQTYGLKYQLSPDQSPYFQAIAVEDGISVEASSNIICDPPLTAEQYREMQFLGWQAPTQTPDEYRNDEVTFDAENESPNFVREFDENFDGMFIASEILTAMTSIYGITDDDFFAFDGRGDADFVDSFGVLKRLKAHPGNPDAVIFVLPTKELGELD